MIDWKSLIIRSPAAARDGIWKISGSATSATPIARIGHRSLRVIVPPNGLDAPASGPLAHPCPHRRNVGNGRILDVPAHAGIRGRHGLARGELPNTGWDD